ncbi:hypothetical protein CAPTEDRAFT_226685 [Capitella teleta]|uniref:Uncharacterized protein n=1 Tax=Capitella teleta TaxID=283909 RepID=R7U3K2_CAPTE|nr:hypothetical protein CAPTEDRAFT_226685 [Capitella teleta]|eukprot:ELT97750.1 hypothetical protein CAPTEDRAFT_226685 [Capitella teleta]
MERSKLPLFRRKLGLSIKKAGNKGKAIAVGVDIPRKKNQESAGEASPSLGHGQHPVPPSGNPPPVLEAATHSSKCKGADASPKAHHSAPQKTQQDSTDHCTDHCLLRGLQSRSLDRPLTPSSVCSSSGSSTEGTLKRREEQSANQLQLLHPQPQQQRQRQEQCPAAPCGDYANLTISHAPQNVSEQTQRIRGRSHSTPTISVTGMNNHISICEQYEVNNLGNSTRQDSSPDVSPSRQRLETSRSHGHLTGISLGHMATIMERSGDWDSLEEIFTAPASPGLPGSMRRGNYASPSCGVRMAEMRATRRSQDGSKSHSPSPEPHSPSPLRQSPLHSPQQTPPQRYSPSFGFTQWGLETASRLQRPCHPIMEEQAEISQMRNAEKTHRKVATAGSLPSTASQKQKQLRKLSLPPDIQSNPAQHKTCSLDPPEPPHLPLRDDPQSPPTTSSSADSYYFVYDNSANIQGKSNDYDEPPAVDSDWSPSAAGHTSSGSYEDLREQQLRTYHISSPSQDSDSNKQVLCNPSRDSVRLAPQPMSPSRTNPPRSETYSHQGAMLSSSSAINVESGRSRADRIYEKLSASAACNPAPAVVVAEETNGDIYTPLANIKNPREAKNKPRNKVQPPVARFRTHGHNSSVLPRTTSASEGPTSSSLSSSLNSSLTSVASASSDSEVSSKTRKAAKPQCPIRPSSDKARPSTNYLRKPQSAPQERPRRRQLPQTPQISEASSMTSLNRRGIPAPLDLHKASKSGSTSSSNGKLKATESLGTTEGSKGNRALMGPPQSPRRRLSSGSIKEGKIPHSPRKTSESNGLRRETDTSIKSTSPAAHAPSHRSVGVPQLTRPTKLKLPLTPNEVKNTRTKAAPKTTHESRSRSSSSSRTQDEESTSSCTASAETDSVSGPPGAENRSSQSKTRSVKKDASTNTKSVLQILRQRGLIGAKRETSPGSEAPAPGIVQVINATRRKSKENDPKTSSNASISESEDHGSSVEGPLSADVDLGPSNQYTEGLQPPLKVSRPPLVSDSVLRDNPLMVRSNEERPKPRLVRPYAASLSRSHSPFSCKFGLHPRGRALSPDKSHTTNVTADHSVKEEGTNTAVDTEETNVNNDDRDEEAASALTDGPLKADEESGAALPLNAAQKSENAGVERDTCTSRQSAAEGGSQRKHPEECTPPPTESEGAVDGGEVYVVHDDQTIEGGLQGQCKTAPPPPSPLPPPPHESSSPEDKNATEPGEVNTTPAHDDNHDDHHHDNNNVDQTTNGDDAGEDDVFEVTSGTLCGPGPRSVHVAMCYHSSLSRTPGRTQPLLPEFLGGKECSRSHSENDCTAPDCCPKRKLLLTSPDKQAVPASLSASDASLRRRRSARDHVDLQEVIQEGHEPWVIYHHQRECGRSFSVVGNLRLSESGYDSWKSQDSGSTLAPPDSSQDDSESSAERLDIECGALEAATTLQGSNLNNLDTLGSCCTLHCLHGQPSLKLGLVAKDTSHLDDSKWSSNDTLLANDAEVATSVDRRDDDTAEGSQQTGGSVPVGLESVLCGGNGPPESNNGQPCISSTSHPACNTLPMQQRGGIIPLQSGKAKTDSNETIKGEDGHEGTLNGQPEARQPGAEGNALLGAGEETEPCSAAIRPQLDQGDRQSGADQTNGVNMCETIRSQRGGKCLPSPDADQCPEPLSQDPLSSNGDYVETMREPFGKEEVVRCNSNDSNRSSPESNSLLTCSSHTYESIEDANMSTSTHSYESIEENAEWLIKLRQKAAGVSTSAILPVLQVNDIPLQNSSKVLEPPVYDKCHSAPDIPRTKYTSTFLTGESSLKRSGAVMTLNVKEDDVEDSHTMTLKETAVSESSLHAEFADNYVSIQQKIAPLAADEVLSVDDDESKETPIRKMRLPQLTKRLKKKWNGEESAGDIVNKREAASPTIVCSDGCSDGGSEEPTSPKSKSIMQPNSKKASKAITRSIPSLRTPSKRPTSLTMSLEKSCKNDVQEEKKRSTGRGLRRPLSLTKKDVNKTTGANPAPSDSHATPIKRQSYPPINQASPLPQPPLSCPPAVPPRTSVFSSKKTPEPEKQKKRPLPKQPRLQSPRKWPPGTSTSRH